MFLMFCMTMAALITLVSNVFDVLHDYGCSDYIEKMRQKVEQAKSAYTYEGCKKKILEEVNK
jgi:hypothetical protein